MPSMLAGWSWLELVGWLELDGGRSKLSDCWSWMVERSKASEWGVRIMVGVERHLSGEGVRGWSWMVGVRKASEWGVRISGWDGRSWLELHGGAFEGSVRGWSWMVGAFEGT